jgi:excisionase family DNA binding protein
MDEILTANEAADYLKINVRTIYRLIREGKIPGCKVGGSWRFRKDILDDWLAGSGGISPELFKKNLPHGHG